MVEDEELEKHISVVLMLVPELLSEEEEEVLIDEERLDEVCL